MRIVEATRWQSALGSSTFAAASCSSSGRYGTSAMTRAKRFWTLRVSASTSRDSTSDVREPGELGGEIGSSSTRPLEVQSLGPLDEDPQRPVGHADQLVDDRSRADRVEIVEAGRLDVLVLDATSASRRSPATTSSISLIERSWPIASGVIDSGKTTVSFNGSTGRIGGRSGGSVIGSKISIAHARLTSITTRSPRGRRAARRAARS